MEAKESEKSDNQTEKSTSNIPDASPTPVQPESVETSLNVKKSSENLQYLN